MYVKVFLALTLISALHTFTASAGQADLTVSDIPSDLTPELRQLIQQTFSDNVLERKRAAFAISKLGDSAAPAMPFLIRLLDDKDLDSQGFEPRYYVDDILVAIGEPGLDACIREAKDYSSMVQLHSINCLSKFDSPRATEALIDLLKSGDDGVRLAAMDCFMTRRDPQVVEPLLDSLQLPLPWFLGVTSIRHRPAVSALGFQQDARAVPDLLNILQNAEEEIWLRHEAAKSLAIIGEPSTIQNLAEQVSDQEVEWLIRAGLAEGIGRYYEIFATGEGLLDTNAWSQVPAFDLLSNILTDEQEILELRIAAAKGLGGLGDIRAVDGLTSIVHAHSKDNLGFWAAVSIVKLTNGNTDAVDVVTTIRDYHEVSESNGLEIKLQHNSLQTLKENGGWKTQLALAYLGWLVALAPILMTLAGIYILFRLVRKSRSHYQPA